MDMKLKVLLWSVNLFWRCALMWLTHQKMFPVFTIKCFHIHRSDTHTSFDIFIHTRQRTQTDTHKPSNQTGVKWRGPYSCCCAVRWYTNWQASLLEATITLAFLPVRHPSRGQRTCVIDWVCLIVVPSLFTRVLIYDRRREGGREGGALGDDGWATEPLITGPSEHTTSWLPASQSN